MPTTTTTAVFVAVAVAVDMLAEEAKWALARVRMEVKDESRMVEVMMVWVGR